MSTDALGYETLYLKSTFHALSVCTLLIVHE
jgi:hypothetical protein